MKQGTKFLLIVLVFTFTGLTKIKAQSYYPGQQEVKTKIALKIPVKAYAFDLKDIKLLDSPFKQNEERNKKWLRSLNNDQLLLTFRVNAGVDTYNAQPLGGWEALHVELRGHTMGHVLSALALIYASTGEKSLKLKGDSLVTELAKVQEMLGQEGYLSAFPQQLIDRAIAGKPVWAPWYTLHKIVSGLLDQYLYADNSQALQVAEKMGDWAYHKMKDLTHDQLAVMLQTEFGGMPETFYNLYAISGKEYYKDLAGMFYHHKVLDPLAEGKDILKGHHANTYIPKIIAEARGYELTGDTRKAQIAEFFWQRVIDHHTYATGGNSNQEHFFAPDSLSKHINSPATTETCNTYNMLKLTLHLFTQNAEIKYADYYERALYNHILASQDPNSGMVCYFMPFKPGMFKVYSTPKNSFWCCVGTGFENHAKYAEAIYFHDNTGVYVNLFIPSVLKWKEKGLQLRQETTYPESEKTQLVVEAAKGERISIRIRYPSWATSGAKVTINGKRLAVKTKPGNYIELTRIWQKGDIVEVSYPMSLHLIPANDNPHIAAIAYGPIILVGAMGNEGVLPPAPYAPNQLDYADYAIPKDLIYSIVTHGEPVSKWVKPVANTEPLTFEVVGQEGSKKLRLIPYYRLHHQRYVLYWNLEF